MSTINPTAYIKANNLLFIAMFIGQLIFGSLLIFMNSVSDFTLDDSISDIFLLVMGIFAIAAFIASHLLFKMRLNAIGNNIALALKLRNYRSAVIIKLALLEMAFFMSVIGYFLISEMLFLVLAGLILFWFILQRPTTQKISTDLSLNSEERNILNQR